MFWTANHHKAAAVVSSVSQSRHMVICWPSVSGYHLLVEPLATKKLQSLAPLCVQQEREGSDFSVVYRRSAEVQVGS